MTPDYSRIWPWIFAVFIPLMVYRRLRRSFGRQALRPTRMIVRMIILAALGAALVPSAFRSGGLSAAEGVGAAIGVVLALWCASRTRFLTQNGQLYYVPHTYAGIAISLLVVGRIGYRFAQLYSAGGLMPAGTGAAAPGAAAPAGSLPGAAPASIVQSPLTVGIFFALIGYYVGYYGWLLWKSKHVAPSDLEATGTPSAAAARAQSDITSA
jgi:hypothetical protein